MIPTTSLKATFPTINLVEMEAELRPLSTEKLVETILESFNKGAVLIARAAICVKLMEERGEPLKGSYMQTLRLVANGQIIPELVWLFAESPAKSEIYRAALPDQRKIAANPMQPVVVPNGKGGYTTQMMDMSQAHSSVVKQVLGTDGFLSLDEQRAYLERKSKDSRNSAKTEEPTLAEDDPLIHTLTIKLTESEWKVIYHQAIEKGIPAREVVRKVLSRSGMFSRK